MVLGKRVAIFYWEWGRNSAPRDGQKSPCQSTIFQPMGGGGVVSCLPGLNQF